jgi:hypothetical protein
VSDSAACSSSTIARPRSRMGRVFAQDGNGRSTANVSYSRKSVRFLVWQSSAQVWAELHERAFRRLGGTTRVVVLDNLKEGVLTPDLYDPALNPLYRDVLAHYGVVALPVASAGGLDTSPSREVVRASCFPKQRRHCSFTDVRRTTGTDGRSSSSSPSRRAPRHRASSTDGRSPSNPYYEDGRRRVRDRGR